jgi:hypothetical protein
LLTNVKAAKMVPILPYDVLLLILEKAFDDIPTFVRFSSILRVPIPYVHIVNTHYNFKLSDEAEAKDLLTFVHTTQWASSVRFLEQKHNGSSFLNSKLLIGDSHIFVLYISKMGPVHITITEFEKREDVFKLVSKMWGKHLKDSYYDTIKEMFEVGHHDDIAIYLLRMFIMLDKAPKVEETLQIGHLNEDCVKELFENRTLLAHDKRWQDTRRSTFEC